MPVSGGRKGEPLRRRSGAPILGIDTSTSEASLALVRNGEDLDGIRWDAGRSQSIEVPPRLARMLEDHDLSPNHLGGIAVGLGPGAFTSLRVGLSLVKGLVMGAGLPLVGVSTLDAIAASHSVGGRSVWALLNAGRSRFCAAHYLVTGGVVRREGEYRLGTLDELAARIEAGSVVAGDLDSDSILDLSRHLGSESEIVGSDGLSPRASWVARLGAERLSRGESDDPSSLEPIYLPTRSQGS